VEHFNQGAIPRWLRVGWLCFVPIGLLFAALIAWQKTILTWHQGPQMVGISLTHILAALFIVGILCCYSLALWLVPALIYLIAGRKRISIADMGMILTSVVAALAMAGPITFFSGPK
jgi:hypothetical protein